MTKKRFERIYADVDVFCRDHNAKGISQLIEKEDYDKIVDLLNELNNEVKSQSLVIKGYQERTEKLFNENEQLKQQLQNEHTMLDNAILLERTRMGQNALKQYKEAIQ